MFRTIMVHVDSLDDSIVRTRFAVALARKFDSTLIGFTDYGDIDRTELEAEFAKNRDAFAAAAKSAGVETDWRAVFAAPSVAIADAAITADLVVLGNGDRSLLGNLSSPSAGDVVLHIGRPILVVPSAYDRTTINTVVVAWKNTPESQRAIADALPFMKGATRVVILNIQEGTEADSSVADAEGFLVRHGIAVTAEALPRGNAAIEDQILDYAKRSNADLIVAGAYGHTRLREWVLGGVTRKLLTSSPIPCLFSH
jgi:nucleotide-binding universal stress UspA family protein